MHPPYTLVFQLCMYILTFDIKVKKVKNALSLRKKQTNCSGVSIHFEILVTNSINIKTALAINRKKKKYDYKNKIKKIKN